MQRHKHYWHIPKIKMSMMFYCYRLSKGAHELCVACVINTSFSLFFKWSTMRIKGAPDIAQACAEKAFNGLCVKIYLNDCDLWTHGTFEDHIKLIDLCLSRLHTNNLKCYALKCKWDIQSTDFLCYWITLRGMKL